MRIFEKTKTPFLQLKKIHNANLQQSALRNGKTIERFLIDDDDANNDRHHYDEMYKKMHAQKMRLQRMNYFLRLWQNHSLFFSRPQFRNIIIHVRSDKR